MVCMYPERLCCYLPSHHKTTAVLLFRLAKALFALVYSFIHHLLCVTNSSGSNHTHLAPHRCKNTSPAHTSLPLTSFLPFRSITLYSLTVNTATASQASP